MINKLKFLPKWIYQKDLIWDTSWLYWIIAVILIMFPMVIYNLFLGRFIQSMEVFGLLIGCFILCYFMSRLSNTKERENK